MRTSAHVGVFVLFISVSFSAVAQNACSALFTFKPDDVLDMAMELEQRFQNFLQLNYQARGDRQVDGEKLTELTSLIDQVISRIDSKEINEQSLLEIAGLNKALDKLEDQVRPSKEATGAGSEILNLEAAFKNPDSLKADVLYEIGGTDILVKRVSFSKQVLQDIFWGSQPHYNAAHVLIYRALQKGRSNGTNSSGIENFIEDRSVFKVRISGHGVGGLRIAGYMKGSDLFLVTYLDTDNHTNMQTQRLFKLVHSAREASE